MMNKNVQPSLTVLAWTAMLIMLQAAAIKAQNESPPPFPPPGKLVDVGGWRLHLNCAGEARAGQPTVILEPGLGDFSVEWSLVQPGVAKFARVCSYDRAGDGWSDWGPHPRTFRQIVYELHTLLDKAGVKPPLILVGHSYGGWLARLYAFTYPSDVAGIALVDAGPDDPLRMTGSGKPAHSSELVKGTPIPAIKTSGPLRVSDIPPEALRQMKAGAEQLIPHANDPPRDKLPPEAQRMRAWALGQLGHIAAGVNPFEIEELAALRAEQAKSEYPLGDKPLIVLTRGIPDENGPDGKAIEAERRRNHAAVAKTSRQGKLIVATRSGHHIQLDEPELVIQSIRDVVAAATQELEKDSLQRGKQLLQRAQQAMGGVAKLAAVKDVTHKMEITLEPAAGGFKLKQTSLFVAPNHIRQEQEMPFGKVTTYSDGASGWLVTPQGPQPIPADVLRLAKGVIFRQPTTLLLSDRDGSRVVKAVGESAVEISTPDGLGVRLEFDPVTGFLARQSYTEPGANGNVRERVEIFSDWREVSGIKMPFKAVQQENGAKTLELIVSEYKINSGITAEQLNRNP